MIKPSFGPLTNHVHGGTMKEEARTAGPSRKTRRAEGPAANSLNDFILRLHTFARDWEQVALEDKTSAAHPLIIGMLNELAAITKEEYDIRHGK